MELFNFGNFSPPYSKLNQESKSDCGLHTVNARLINNFFKKALGWKIHLSNNHARH